MKLKNLLFACVIAIIPISDQLYIIAKPPFLKNDEFSCWSDSVVWLLYNIPELVDKLIENKESYKEGSDLRNLANLFQSMSSRESADEKNKKNIIKLEDAIKDAQKTFHKNTACPLMGIVEFGLSSSETFLTKIIKTVSPTSNILSEYVKFDDEPYTLIGKQYKNKIEKKYPDIHIDVSIPSDYLYIIDKDSFFDKDNTVKESIDFTEIDDEGKPAEVIYTYELIGFTVGTAGHVIAYIKDQREKGNPWYYCDDSNQKYEVVLKNPPVNWSKEVQEKKEIREKNNAIEEENKKIMDEKKNKPLITDDINIPNIAIYKKLPNSNSIDTFAQALKSVIK